jgi:hypothetical protein
VEEDEEQDGGKEHQIIGQGEMIITSADDRDTMGDNQPILLPGQGQEVCEHTPKPQPPAPGPKPETPDPYPLP